MSYLHSFHHMTQLTYKQFREELRKEQKYYRKSRLRELLLGRSDVGRYVYHMRWTEFCLTKSQVAPPVNIFIQLLRIYHQRRMHVYARRTGFQIGLGTTGWGLRICHWGYIIINKDAKVGRNLTIYPGSTIGAYKGAPTLGDNVFIGLGAKVIGHITVGDNAMVAPNAVVTKDVPANCIVAGVPAKIISTQRYKQQ